MDVTRRQVLAGVGGLAGSAAVTSVTANSSSDPSLRQHPREDFPLRGDFAIPDGLTYINSAYIHPMPRASADNVRRYVAARSQADTDAWERLDIKAEFAALINADPSEIAFIPNTTTGENLIVNGLDLKGSGGNLVTDALHFEGALIHLEVLRQQGLDVRIVRPRAWRIEPADLERVVDKRTKLIELSHVAMFTGFQHDLKAVCDLAHANGALVYADVAQSAGATPLDVKATGVDFCACSSFKWLMGDFGLGFLYARKDLLDRVVRRAQYGYYQASQMTTHFLPHDPPGTDPFTFELSTDATGHFEVGSQANGAWAALSKSLPYVRRLGVENIEAHRQPLLRKLHREMPALGFEAITPADSKSALITFARKDASNLEEQLKRARVNVRVGQNFIRISPSVFNDMGDIDRLLSALS